MTAPTPSPVAAAPDCQMPCDEDCEVATLTGSAPPVHCWNHHRPSHKPDWHDPVACDAAHPLSRSTPGPSPVAAEIAKIKERAKDERAVARTVPRRRSALDTLALVAALEAVLALTVEWDQRSAALAAEPPVAAQYQTCRAQTLSECANRARVAIESALRGTQGGEGQ